MARREEACSSKFDCTLGYSTAHISRGLIPREAKRLPFVRDLPALLFSAILADGSHVLYIYCHLCSPPSSSLSFYVVPSIFFPGSYPSSRLIYSIYFLPTISFLRILRTIELSGTPRIHTKMVLSSHDGLAIAQIVIYSPLVVLSISLCIRHSFRVFVGWLFLFIFCAIRIVGPALQLASIKSPKTIAFHTTPIELFAVGQVVLLYTTLGLLARVANGINSIRNTGIKGLYIHLIRLPLIAGIVLVIVGGITSAGTWISSGNYPIDRLSKIGTIIIVAAFAVIVLMALGFVPRRTEAEHSDALLLDTILTSFPLILIRLIYSLLIAYVDDAAFNPLDGNAAAQGLMAVAEEAIVVILYVIAGFKISRLPKNATAKTENKSSRRRSRITRGQRLQNFSSRVWGRKAAQPNVAGVDPKEEFAESAC